MAEPTVRSRAVFFVGGYDPKSPQDFFARMERESRKSAKLWDASMRSGPIRPLAEGDAARVTLDTEAPGWTCRTDFTFLVLDRIVLADFARPLPVRLGKYLLAFGGFVLSGTAFRIFRHAWRFGLYFLFPMLCLLAFAAVGGVAGWLASWWSGMAWLGIPVAGTMFFALLATLGRRWPVAHLMDLWSFSHAFMLGGRPDAEALMTRFASLIADTLRAERYDEVLLVGHSTGGLLILDIAARCQAIDPAVFGRAGTTSVLTLGSTALKAGLHPGARAFRADVARLARDERLSWHEVQCMTDIINFHRTDPAALMGVRRGEKDWQFPLVRDVHVKRMLTPDQYRRVRRSFFRVHYQYVSGNSRPYFFDFFLVCCGPSTLSARMRDRTIGPGTEPATHIARPGHAA